MGITVVPVVPLSVIERQAVIAHLKGMIARMYGFHWLFDRRAAVAHAINMSIDEEDRSARSAAFSWDIDLVNELWKEATT